MLNFIGTNNFVKKINLYKFKKPTTNKFVFLFCTIKQTCRKKKVKFMSKILWKLNLPGMVK
jgi:hypothetical protein